MQEAGSGKEVPQGDTPVASAFLYKYKGTAGAKARDRGLEAGDRVDEG